MNATTSSKWKKFSDYEIKTSEDGTKYVCPVSGSSSVFYDPMLTPDKTAIVVMTAADDFKKKKDPETIILDLARSVGLPGFAMDSPDEYVFPFGGSNASKTDLLLTQRGEEYSVVFSADYAEKYDDICAWLDSIDPSIAKGSDSTNLKSIAEHIISTLTAEEKLHICPICNKFYCSDDPENKTCSKACDFQLLLTDREACIEKGFYNHMFSTPRVTREIQDDDTNAEESTEDSAVVDAASVQSS